MQHIFEMIRANGDWFYPITFVWTALEGETFVIFAGLAAQKGLLNIWLLFLAAWLGSFFGDQIFFLLGRQFGTRIIARKPALEPKLNIVFNALERYATVFILSYRFMYGIRNVSGIAIGMSHITWRRFAMLNLTAAFIWAATFSGAGYLFGDVIARAAGKEDEMSNSVHTVTMAVVGLVALIVVSRYLIKRWVDKRSAKLAEPQSNAAE